VESKIPDEIVQSVCGLGRGEGCCAFLTARNGFECAKALPGLDSAIRARLEAGEMTAQGDNCSGPPDFATDPLTRSLADVEAGRTTLYMDDESFLASLADDPDA
jgi:hypothetical protein